MFPTPSFPNHFGSPCQLSILSQKFDSVSSPGRYPRPSSGKYICGCFYRLVGPKRKGFFEFCLGIIRHNPNSIKILSREGMENGSSSKFTLSHKKIVHTCLFCQSTPAFFTQNMRSKRLMAIPKTLHFVPLHPTKATTKKKSGRRSSSSSSFSSTIVLLAWAKYRVCVLTSRISHMKAPKNLSFGRLTDSVDYLDDE